jgi:hypothetical protein
MCFFLWFSSFIFLSLNKGGVFILFFAKAWGLEVWLGQLWQW